MSSGPAGSVADQIADQYSRDADNWVADVDNAVDGLNGYPDQLTTKEVTASQRAGQGNYCSGAQKTVTKVSTPPVLDPAGDAKTSLTYRAAAERAKTLSAQAKAVQKLLGDVVQFCTWLDTFESGQPAALATNGTLFAQPYRYTGKITVAGKSHTCPDGSSCYTPDQSLWPRISTLWQKQGAATAQGAAAIQKDRVPCLVAGWERMCDLVVQDQLDYQKWADDYAKAFDDNKDKDLLTASAEISKAAAKFDSEVLIPLANLPGIYRQLAPGQKYDAHVSTTGANIWIEHITGVLKDLKAATAKL